MHIVIRRRVPLPAALILGVFLASLPFLIIFAMGQEKKTIQITEEATSFVCKTYLAQKADPLNSFSSINTTNMLKRGLLERAIEDALSKETELAVQMKQEQLRDYAFKKRIETRAKDACGVDKSFTSLILKEVEKVSLPE